MRYIEYTIKLYIDKLNKDIEDCNKNKDYKGVILNQDKIIGVSEWYLMYLRFENDTMRINNMKGGYIYDRD